MPDSVLALARDQLGQIVLGTIFLFVGLAACVMAAVRGRGGVRILVWFGLFSGLYGARIWVQTPAVFSVLPGSLRGSSETLVIIITHLVLIPAVLFWMEMSRGRLRAFLRAVLAAACAIAVLAIASALLSGRARVWMLLNDALVIVFLLPLAVATVVPRLARRYVVAPSPISAAATVILACAALHANLKDILHLPSLPSFEPLAFGMFIVAIGIVTAQKIFAGERRLVEIESELAVAREIQRSILPAGTPEIRDLRVSAAYSPMTEVAGDFYEFLPVDSHRAGFLVADVSGHGVPAALVASMIKVAVHSVAGSASEPQIVLRGLNRILTAQLRGQLVSAAYLWLDTEARCAAYSAAGHPPLLRWRDGRLERIESNGLLFGVLPTADYPVLELPVNPGDRFLLYTDGVTEPQNAAGIEFGEQRLEQVIRDGQSASPAGLSRELLREIRQWQPAATSQHDDITLLVVDVV